MAKEGPPDPALKEAAKNGRYQVLNEAFVGICRKTPTIQTVVEGNQRQSVDLKRDLLLLFSPLLRSLLSSLPPSSSPLLILPGASLPSLLAMETLLETGSVDRIVPTEQIQNVARMLGIPLKNITTVYKELNSIENLDTYHIEEELVELPPPTSEHSTPLPIHTINAPVSNLQPSNLQTATFTGSNPAFPAVPDTPIILDHVLHPPESPVPKVKLPQPDIQSTLVALAQIPQAIENPNAEKSVSETGPANFACQVGSDKCSKKVLANMTRLRHHYSMHFIRSLEKNLERNLNRFTDECCRKFVDNKLNFIVHLGTQHKKIDKIVLEYKRIDLEAMDNEQLKKKQIMTQKQGENKKEPSEMKCNYELKCEVCGKDFSISSSLQIHVTGHFNSELVKRVEDLTDGQTCRLCREHFKSKHGLVYHIGNKHGRLNDILVEKGFKVLPCFVSYTPTKKADKIQKHLEKSIVDVKEENSDDEPIGFDF